MKTYFIICSCLFCIVMGGAWGITGDAQARRMNPEDIKKQLEESGVNADGSQTREERLEALRNQKGLPEADVDQGYGAKSNRKDASEVKIPSGTRVMVRLDESLSSAEIGEGEQFTGKLDADLVVDGVLLASSGSKVYGTIVTSTRARNVAGTSVLEFMLVGMNIDSQMRSIESNQIKVESKKSGRLHASAAIDTDEVIEFSIGEVGSGVESSGTETIAGPDKKATDRIDERRNSRRHRRD